MRCLLVVFMLTLLQQDVQTRMCSSGLPPVGFRQLETHTVPTRPAPFKGHCPQIGVSYESGECRAWDISVMVVLRQDDDVAHTLDLIASIKRFVKKITVACDWHSYLKIFTPRSSMMDLESCLFAYFGTPAIDESLDEELTLNNTVLPRMNHTDPQQQPIVKMFYDHLNCVSQDPSRGKVVFFLTNIKCDNGCEDSTRAVEQFVQNQTTVVNNLRSVGVILKMIYLDRGDDQLECNVKTILRFVAKYEQVIIASETIGSLDEYAEMMNTCPITEKKEQNEPHIVSPVTAKVLIVGCSLILASCLLSSCVYMTVQKRRARKTLIQEFRSQQEQRVEDCKELFEHKISTVEEMYTQLQMMSACCSVDTEYEVCTSDLLLEASSVVGCGAFGKVHRGFLKSSALPGTSVKTLDPFTDLLPPSPTSPNKQASFELAGEPGFQVAVKRLSASATDEDRWAAFNEMKKLKALQGHINVVSLIATISSYSDPVIILEYCEYGDLLGLIRTHARHETETCVFNGGRCLSNKTLFSFAMQISEAMVYIGSHGIVHRDLAARNVLITDHLTAKVCDFGLSRYTEESMAVTRICHKWAAPEVLKDAKFSMKSDVWSYGIVLYEVFSGGLGPFPGIQPENMRAELEKCNRPTLSKDVHQTIRSLLDSCLSCCALARPSFHEIRKTIRPLLNTCDTYLGYIDME